MPELLADDHVVSEFGGASNKIFYSAEVPQTFACGRPLRAKTLIERSPTNCTRALACQAHEESNAAQYERVPPWPLVLPGRGIKILIEAHMLLTWLRVVNATRRDLGLSRSPAQTGCNKRGSPQA